MPSKRHLTLSFASLVQDEDQYNAGLAKVDPTYYYNQLKPILRFDETRDVELAPAYVSLVTDPKRLSAIIAYLSNRYPLNSLSHCLRVRKSQTPPITIELLIGLKSEVDAAPSENLEAFKTAFNLKVHEALVPRYCPLMREQHKAWTEIWPISYRAHVATTPLDPSSWIGPEHIQTLASYMRQLFPLAAKSGNACVILNSQFEELAIAGCTDVSPLTHCAMNAINIVAQNQKQQMPDTEIEHIKRTVAPSSSADSDANADKPQEYLCTGAIALFVREPCIMCSMALLHSRIACVIYALSNVQSGGLGSRFSVHCEPALNHHFYAYKGFLAEEST